MIKGENITLRRGTKILLHEANMVIHPGERVGIVGKNGAGKTSLFALLEGSIDIDEGTLFIPPNWKIASVEQEIHDTHSSAVAFVMDGDKELKQLNHEKDRLIQAEKSPETIQALAQIETRLDEIQAWNAQARAKQLLSGLGFHSSEWDKPVSAFSGGWQMRLNLARALMTPSDLLLLDEPTNHLDLDAILWLEKWLSQYPGTVLMISHDSEFLNSVSKVILSFEQQKLHRYKGNFDSYLTQKAEKLKQENLAIEKQEKQTAKLEAFISRFKAKASKAKQAQSRVKALEKMQKLAPVYQESGIHIQLSSPKNMPDPLIVLDKACMGYADHPVLNHIDLMVRAKSRVGILGVNGAGKSTFIKSLIGEIPLLGGHITVSKGTKIGYFAQHQLDLLDLDSTPLQHLQRIAPDANEQTLRNYLGRFAFHGNQVLEPVRPLSGGEKARLALAMIVWEEPNLLLLDEPSNHLDMDTREALANALTEFEGSVLLVSHDRHLLRTTVDEFWVVFNGKIEAFNGDLEDYRQWLNDQLTPTQNTAEKTHIDRKEQKRIEAQERQRLAQLRKPILQKIEALEKELDAIQKRLSELNEQIADPHLYEDQNKETCIKVMFEHGELNTKNTTLEAEWLSLQEKLETIL
ncbi:ABC-F family ATP-binding cassette domain-containing protein [Basilea psittacipulmonis]|uniref:Probable ATP-binding protein YheS n=1 Tax=Basilea psittacipulmonis DSM 24701 TaxID=1072685 RepID=A0A077DIG7_9BURK|nr:ATP-binding cassette domain-containing protein [Basilea psittacipulmonis]AIL32968.1 ABC transporter [Basilea psittacipulmonis DSM 24701]